MNYQLYDYDHLEFDNDTTKDIKHLFLTYLISINSRDINVNELENNIRNAINNILNDDYSLFNNHRYICLKLKNGLIRIKKEDIIFIAKDVQGVIIHMRTEKYQTTYSLQQMEKLLDDGLFFRSHKSYIINIEQISRITRIYDRIFEVQFYEYQEKALITKANYFKLLEINGLD